MNSSMGAEDSGKRKVPELLAPAGSPATFLTGLDAGADAFYLGIGRYNARGRAQNFQLEDLPGVTQLARENGRRLYLAMNVLATDGEIPEYIRILEQAEASGVDAVIVQDLGILYLARRYFPDLAVHASTQMFLHNSLHVEAAHGRGVSRVILPRELTLDEIRRIRSRTAAELEIFIHGALCFSFSGMCLASSHLFGESGNRGLCKQVCRFVFEARHVRHPFAMRDLEGRTHLEAVLETGVDSLKVEGRLRSVDYLQEVVSYYRSCLDAHAAGSPLPESPDWQHSRSTTPGFFSRIPYGEMRCTDEKTWIGEPVGRVTRSERGKLHLAFDRRVRTGDRLRVLLENGVKIHEFTLLQPAAKQCQVSVSKKLPGKTEPWMVVRVGKSSPPSLRRLKPGSGRPKRYPVDLKVTCTGQALDLEARLEGTPAHSATFLLETANRKKALDEERIGACFAKTDRHPFLLQTLSICLREPFTAPVRELNRIRREFYEGLERFHDGERTKANANRREAIDREQRAIAFQWKSEETGRTVQVMPYEEFMKQGPAFDIPPVLWLELPLFVSEGRLPDLFAELRELFPDSRLRFLGHSLGWLDLLRQHIPEARIGSGSYLYCFNRFSYRMLRHVGATTLLLSPDFPEEETRHLKTLRGVTALQKPGRHFFVTRQSLPESTYRFRGRDLEVIQHTEYSEILLCSGPKKGRENVKLFSSEP